MLYEVITAHGTPGERPRCAAFGFQQQRQCDAREHEPDAAAGEVDRDRGGGEPGALGKDVV